MVWLTFDIFFASTPNNVQSICIICGSILGYDKVVVWRLSQWEIFTPNRWKTDPWGFPQLQEDPLLAEYHSCAKLLLNQSRIYHIHQRPSCSDQNFNHLSRIADEPKEPAERTTKREASATEGDCRAWVWSPLSSTYSTPMARFPLDQNQPTNTRYFPETYSNMTRTTRFRISITKFLLLSSRG
jgi:hypothetical protein